MKSVRIWTGTRTLIHSAISTTSCATALNRNREYTYRRYADHIDPILHRLIDRGKCLELNTGGLKYGLGEPNPCREVLKRYHDLGGELITVGSDAHAPEHIAYDFATAETILKETGFRYYTVFRERKAKQLPL